MTHRSLLVALAAAMVLLAGCTGSLSGSPSAGDGAVAGDTGTVNFYISDEPNAIEDFEHLNVTITKVGFQQAGEDGDEMDENETEMPETEAPENETEAPENETEAPENETEAPENETEAPENETEAPEPDEDDGDADDADESGGWVEFDVDSRTVDLTELQGANSSLVDQFDLPEGSYNKVFVHVSEVNATLENGESVNVKLPSQKLQINKQFRVENGSEVDFVFDIAVHKAGNSGKYILKPVISQSGTDVPINDVDAEDDEREDEDEREDDGSELQATFVGDVTPGEDATVEVMRDGEPVENATVYVNDAEVGTTDADGRLTFEVPDGEELEVRVEHSDSEAELEREFESEGETPVASPTPVPDA